MNLSCRFTSCQWCGREDEIFEHFETCHKSFLREPKGNLYFDFSLKDLQQEVFVLCSPNGLYWFMQNLREPRNDGLDFGVFHMGESEKVQYQLKLGLKRDGHWEYWGPHDSVQDDNKHSNCDNYNLKFDFEYLEIINETMPSRRLRLYFGEYDDSDDKIIPRPQIIELPEGGENLNRLCVEKFICAVCFEYIRRDARFCENKHCVCFNCLDEMLKRKKLKCPTCRGQYLYDCVDHDVERLLRMVQWPDTPQIKADGEKLKFLPNI